MNNHFENKDALQMLLCSWHSKLPNWHHSGLLNEILSILAAQGDENFPAVRIKGSEKITNCWFYQASLLAPFGGFLIRVYSHM